MIDFELSEGDKALVDEAREQALLARKYARFYDKNENVVPPRELEEAIGRPDPFEQRLDMDGQISGKAIVEALLHMEMFRGDVVPLRVPKISLGNYVLESVGSPEQIERWGKSRIAIGITEPGAGSDPSRVTTTAIYDEARDEWVINGEKIFITYAEDADAVMLFARAKGADGNFSLTTFLVEKGTPGFTVGPQVKKMGIRGEDTAGLVFQDCRLPSFNHVKANFKTVFEVFNFSRPIVAAFGLGTSRALLDFTLEKLAEVEIVPEYSSGLAGRSAIVDRLLELEAEYEAAWLCVVRAKWLEDKRGGVKVEASTAKAMGGMASRRITQGCLELLGNFSLTEAELAEKWFRDARISDIYEGPGEVQRLIIARSLLGYSQKDLR
ncbi:MULTISPECIES: acyl-CoA dehydrogenase family protein [Caballeronia]|uniref:Acyl-CoA dehydrogenase n=1 Tax=Caballeronia zhejiangensis TaxID=871203 RepID=A0A656QD96_9BURK|nr:MULTISPECIES: acyl-CoA dehydrogenase [Caballeronia]EKS71826.1 acyl-CoA dehydrogenase domain-containing protein [Burkholderia sp. SJ98]KAK44018.1 acyl-CoA dehydrogenase [Caballeronia jiangsuensis]KDR25334.1 acyl-CoA dehydrogenase [Caballeronia zhejiangensis]